MRNLVFSKFFKSAIKVDRCPAVNVYKRGIEIDFHPLHAWFDWPAGVTFDGCDLTVDSSIMASMIEMSEAHGGLASVTGERLPVEETEDGNKSERPEPAMMHVKFQDGAGFDCKASVCNTEYDFKDDADVCKLVTQYDRQHYAPCTLGTLIRLAERTTPNYALGRETHWCMADRYRKIVVQPTPKEDWDGMNRVRDRWSGCEWVYPALEQSVNPVKLLRREFKQGGLPESFHYPLETDKGEFRLNHISQRAIILLDGKPVGLMVHDDCDEPFTDKVPPEWCAIRLPDGVTGRAIYSVLPDEGDEFKPSFQQALLDFADRF